MTHFFPEEFNCRKNGSSGERSNFGGKGRSFTVARLMTLRCDPDDPVTEIIAMKIIELAKAGEVDPGRICARVLAAFAK
jgi:hypothetical protein